MVNVSVFILFKLHSCIFCAMNKRKRMENEVHRKKETKSRLQFFFYFLSLDIFFSLLLFCFCSGYYCFVNERECVCARNAKKNSFMTKRKLSFVSNQLIPINRNNILLLPLAPLYIRIQNEKQRIKKNGKFYFLLKLMPYEQIHYNNHIELHNISFLCQTKTFGEQFSFRFFGFFFCCFVYIFLCFVVNVPHFTFHRLL